MNEPGDRGAYRTERVVWEARVPVAGRERR